MKNDKCKGYMEIVLKTTQDGFWILDRAGKVIDANPAYCLMSGYTKDELLQLSIPDLDHEEPGKTSKRINRVIENGSERFETCHHRKDGSIFDVEISTTWSKEGGCFYCFCHHITERKQMEKTLRKRTKSLYERVKELNCLYSISDLIGEPNITLEEVFQGLFGLIQASWQYPGITCSRIFLDDEEYKAENFKETIWKQSSEIFVNGKRRGGLEICYLKEKLEIDEGPFLKEERNLIDAIAERLGHVIERMRSRSALQESDDRLRILYNNSPDMYASVSAHDAKILMCNETLLKKTGYSREELIGFPIFKIYPDNRMADAKKASQKLVKGKIIEDKELTLKRKDGSKIEASLNVNAIKDEAGRVKYSMCSWRDITDAKRAEKDKEKMVRLESLGVLAGGIAHDFNNLLAVIMGNVSIALQKEGKEKREVLQKVLKAIEKTTGLSNQLLTFAKGGRPSIQVTSMSKIIEESLNLNLGKSSEHSCETIFQDDLWPIEVDENQIGQVFQNLLINAKQAMPEGGTINIEAKNIVDPIAVGSGNYIHVSVRDAGIGIPEKYLSKIFDPYFSTKQKEGGGTGLGLAVSHSIIRKHNGLINAESEPGIGTLFNIFLPASKKQILEEEVVLEEDEVHKSLKILVMDDEELIREMVGDMLSAIGHRCKSVKDGKEAIEAYKNALDSEPFDLVILDLTIPGGMGGVETLSYLKKLDKGVIVIVSSGYADELPEGFKVALPKPYNVKSLKEVLDKISK